MANTIPKLFFLASAIIFIFIFVGAPKTHCQACQLEYGSEKLNGYEAYEMFEEACISYDKPWDTQDVYVPIEDIKVNQSGNLTTYSWDKEAELTREELDNLSS